MGKGQGKGKGSCSSCDPIENKELTDHPHRHCTDVLWLALFTAFCVGCFYIAGWCFDNGQPYRIIYGADSWGNVCGRDNADLVPLCIAGNIENCGLDMTDRPHLFYSSVGADGADALDSTQKVKICASSCSDVIVDCTSNIQACMDLGVCLNTAPYTPFESWHPDAGLEYNGTYTGCPDEVAITIEAPYIRRCIPDALSNAGISGAVEEQIDSFVSYSNAESYINDIVQSFTASLTEVLYCLLIAFFLAYIILILMKYFVWYIVWFTIVLAIVACIAVTWFLWERYEFYDDDIKKQEEYGLPITNAEKNERDFYYYSAILFLITTIIITCITVFARKEIGIAIKVYKCASDALKKMPSMLLTPLFIWICILAWAALWVYVMIYMISADDFATVNATVANGYGHVKYIPKENYDNFFWYYLFALFWVMQFFIAIEQLILAGCVTSFYVTTGQPPRGIFCRSFYRVFRFHLGTAAIGSLIIAICQMMRALFEYIKRKTNSEEKTSVQKFFECCMTCCLWCLEKCLKFINKNAYIETMLYGMPFCNAACTAFATILANIIKVAMLTFVGFLVIFVIKLSVSATVAFIAFEWIKDKPDVPLVGLVVFILAIVAWVIADAFASVYEMTADTLLICYCEDLDANKNKTDADGSKGKLIGPPKLVGRLGAIGAVKDNKTGQNEATN